MIEDDMSLMNIIADEEEPQKRKRRTDDEILADLEKKRLQIREREKQIKARMSAKERNARTRRGGWIVGEIEKILDRKIDDEDARKIIAFLKNQEKRGKFFSKALEKEEDDV